MQKLQSPHGLGLCVTGTLLLVGLVVWQHEGSPAALPAKTANAADAEHQYRGESAAASEMASENGYRTTPASGDPYRCLVCQLTQSGYGHDARPGQKLSARQSLTDLATPSTDWMVRYFQIHSHGQLRQDPLARGAGSTAGLGQPRLAQ
jgi:hypothetical protein